METVYRDYSPKGVKFFYIYKALAHPETNGYVTPYTQQERLLHVKEAQRTLGSGIPWICDTIDNDLKHALGNAPNSEFILDPKGIVVRRRSWSKPSELRRDLEELVGPVAEPTKISDLNLKKQPPPKVAARGVVPRVQMPARMKPLRIEPQPSREPFYAKLRAEADDNALRGRDGTMYIGFHMDPIYRVHWNNLAAPVKFEIESPAGVTVQPNQGEGPKVDAAEGDIDPREFLVRVSGRSSEPLKLSVRYFACNDDEGWCKPVSQEYLVYFDVDRDGGAARRSVRSGANERPMSEAGGGPRPSGNAGNRIMGMVVRVDAEDRTITIRTRDGKQRTLKVAENAMVARDRKRSSIQQLRQRDRVMLFLGSGENEDAPTVLRIMSRSGSGFSPRPG